MGIVIDIILVGIIALSTFLGYKKGLVKLGAGLFAGILAIILTIILYKPVGQLIIDKTDFDEKIQSTITEKAQKAIEDKIPTNNTITENISNEVLPTQAQNISEKVIFAVTGIVLFVFSKIIIKIIISLMDIIAKLPILKQFNEVGGIAYGLLRGALIAGIFIVLLGVYSNIKPESHMQEKIDSSYLTKIVYKNIVKF